MAKIYYVGDWAVLTGPVFAETPFYYSHKGLDIFNYGKWLKEALESTGQHTVALGPDLGFLQQARPGGLRARSWRNTTSSSSATSTPSSSSSPRASSTGRSSATAS